MENTDAQKAKIERFKAMGIPVPIEKPLVDQPIVNVKDPKMLQRIQEIRSGAKKGEFKEILSTGNKQGAFQPLPEPKAKKNPSNPNGGSKAPALQDFSPFGGSSEISLAASLFDDSPAPQVAKRRSPGNRLDESEMPEPQPSNIINDFRTRLQAKASTLSYQAPQTNNFGFESTGPSQAEFSSPNALKNMVESVASEVAKKVAAETMKTVLEGYLSKKDNLNENAKNTYKKVQDDIVLIEGKYYRLVPVKVKAKK